MLVKLFIFYFLNFYEGWTFFSHCFFFLNILLFFWHFFFLLTFKKNSMFLIFWCYYFHFNIDFLLLALFLKKSLDIFFWAYLSQFCSFSSTCNTSMGLLCFVFNLKLSQVLPNFFCFVQFVSPSSKFNIFKL